MRVATAIASSASQALRGRGTLTAAPPVRVAQAHDASSPAQSWYCDGVEGVDLWCELEDAGAHELLRVILGGPGSVAPTALERSIVRETVERLLSSTGSAWEERSPHLLPPDSGWSCRLTIANAADSGAHIALLAPAAVEPSLPNARVDLRSIPLQVSVLLPAAHARVDAIAKWRVGDDVPLNCEANAAVDLTVGCVRVACGTLGSSRGRRAIEIRAASIASAE